MQMTTDKKKIRLIPFHLIHICTKSDWYCEIKPYANIIFHTSLVEYYNISEVLHTNTWHYSDVIMGRIASQITSLTIVYSIVYSGVDQRKHQSSSSLAFVRGIHRRPMNSPHKWPVTRKKFPFDDFIMGALHMSGTLRWRLVLWRPGINQQNRFRAFSFQGRHYFFAFSRSILSPFRISI